MLRIVWQKAVIGEGHIFDRMTVMTRVGFVIGIFYFGLDRKISKIPKSRGSGSGYENPKKNFGFLRFSGHRDIFEILP